MAMPKVGDRVIAWHRPSRKEVAVVVTAIRGSKIWGQDKNFDLYKGLEKWRYPADAKSNGNGNGQKNADLLQSSAGSDNEQPLPTERDGIIAHLENEELGAESSPEVLDRTENDLPIPGGMVADEQPELKNAKLRAFGVRFSPKFEEKYLSNFGKNHKTEENGQLNLLESEEGEEAPDPDDYPNLEEFKAAWDEWAASREDEEEEEVAHFSAQEIWDQWKDEKEEELKKCNLNGSTYAQELAQDSHLQESNCGENTLTDSANETSIANESSKQDFLAQKLSQISETGLSQENMDAEAIKQTSLQPVHLVSPFPLTESDSELTMNGIASQPFSEQLNQSNPDLQSSKTSLDSSPAQSDQEAIASTSLESLSDFPNAGTYANGQLSAAPTLEPPGVEEDSLLLRSPGALSSTGNGRPPGICKLDDRLKKLGLIAPGEVTSPEFLEHGYQLPLGFSNPDEQRTAAELAQVQAQDLSLESPPVMESTAIAEQPSAIALIGESQPSRSAGLSISIGSLSKDELLERVIIEHQSISIIEREEMELALQKLERARAAGLYLQEFKRRCRHGEFEVSLESSGIRPRTAQDYMAIAKNWELLEEKARSFALLESQTLGVGWALNTIREEKRQLKSAAPLVEEATVNTYSQPQLEFSSVEQEQTAVAENLGLKNGKTVLPDLRDSDRSREEAVNPFTVPEVVITEAVNVNNGTSALQELKSVAAGDESATAESDEQKPAEEYIHGPNINNWDIWLKETTIGVASNVEHFSDEQLTFLMRKISEEKQKRFKSSVTEEIVDKIWDEFFIPLSQRKREQLVIALLNAII